MKILESKFIPLKIPFLGEFSHAAKVRSFSDTFLVRIKTDAGILGYGEGLVRPYVTGESLEETQELFKKLSLPLSKVEWKLQDHSDAMLALSSLTHSLDEVFKGEESKRPKDVIAYNGLRCALELAILDALLQEKQMSLAHLLKPVKKNVVYSGIISSGSHESAIKVAKHMMQFGLSDFKLKIGKKDPLGLIRKIRSTIGENNTLRIDANSAFTVQETIDLAEKLSELKISAIEQPIPRGRVEELAPIQQSTSIPIMADESLISIEDARNLIHAKAVKMFNIRLAKCGGLARCLEIAKLAKQHGIAFQLGCMVGESSLLSAVGRHFSASLEECLFTEGSFGTLLLRQDIANPSIKFGHGGKAPLLKGLSFGINLDVEAIESLIRKDGD